MPYLINRSQGAPMSLRFDKFAVSVLEKSFDFMPAVTMKDAQTCTQLFRETLSEESFGKYRRLLGDFLHSRIDFQAFSSAVEDLIKGLDGLLLEFNKFLPQMEELASHSHRTRSVAAASTAVLNTDDSANDNNNDWVPHYVLKYSKPRKKEIWESKSCKIRKSACEKFLTWVKQHVESDGTYRDFLELMNGYQEHKDIDRLDKQVLKLFREQPELHIEFTVFLVDAIEARDEREFRSSNLEVREDEGVKGPEVIETAPHDENLCRFEDAKSAGEDVVYHDLDEFKKQGSSEEQSREEESCEDDIDIDLFCHEDMVAILKEIESSTRLTSVKKLEIRKLGSFLPVCSSFH